MDHSSSAASGGSSACSARCIDCTRPSEHLLCDACLARITATPVPGERLPWERGREGLIADLKEDAMDGSNEALALGVLFIENADVECLEGVRVASADALRLLLERTHRAVEALLGSDGDSAFATVWRMQEVVRRLRLAARLSKYLLRAAMVADLKSGGAREQW